MLSSCRVVPIPTPPATTRAQERAARLQGLQQQLPGDAVQLVFERLPLEEQVFTVSALSGAWRRWTQPKQIELRERRRQLETLRPQRYYGFLCAYAVPLWLGQKMWPALTEDQHMRLFCRAARHGDVRALRWMWRQQREQALIWRTEWFDQQRSLAYMVAAAGGHLKALQLLQALRPPCSLRSCVCAAAAEGGHLTVLQWLRVQQPPCPWDVKACWHAAGSGQLEVLQWLRAQQPPCPWDARVCATAAETGQLAALQWLRAQQPPCPWDEIACERAATHGYLAVLQWLRAQDPPCPRGKEACMDAAREGHQNLQCCSGYGRRTHPARGMSARARLRPPTASLQCCSGCGRGTRRARGIRVHARTRPARAILQCCSGCGSRPPLPVGCKCVRGCGWQGPACRAAVAASAGPALPVG